jgi:guanylate kinase
MNDKNKMNKLFVVSGHSGSGKTTVMRELMDNELLSFTTREKRDNEKEGTDYQFISLDDYNKMFEDGTLAEWTEYDNNFYGLTGEELSNKLSIGHAFSVVDVNGMKQLCDYYENVVTIFIYTDYDVAYRNMTRRKDKAKNIENRLSTYEEEIKNKNLYDYVIKNVEGNFDNTVEIFRNIILSEVSG